ncbi:MAG: hypothetical protein ACFE9C_07225 [Candidatus Hodarchaeota archaeon]
MVQVLEKEKIYIIIPEIKEKAEKVKEKQKKINKKIKVLNHAKLVKKNININNLKNNIDSSMFGVNYFNR